MISFALVIAAAAAAISLILSAVIGQAILGGITDMYEGKENEEDSRTVGPDRHQDNDPFLT